MAAPIYHTADMVRAIPDDGHRYEVVAGELLVTPSPRLRHQYLLGQIEFALQTWLHSQPVGVLFHSPADISWGPDVLVQPDLFVVPFDQARSLDWAAVQDLLLVVEVLSPSTARADRFVKRRRYQEAGVPLYWIVDDEARHAEVWTPADQFPRIERVALEWAPTGAVQPFRYELQEVFRPI